MKANFKKYIVGILSLSALIVLASCEQVIDWPVENDQIRLVVEGRITDELKVHQIKLTETANYFNPAAPVPVENATVTVSDGSTTYTFTESSAGIYESNPFAGEAGKTYELTITLATPLANETVFRATSTLLAAAQLDALVAINEEEEDEEGEIIEVTNLYFWGTGNLAVENTYLMEVYVNETLETDSIDKVTVFDDEFLTEEFEDFLFYQIYEPAATVGDSITLVMHVVEKDFTEFYDQLLTESEPRDPFGLSSPPANVMGNISGSGLGYFYASSVTKVSTFVE
ncbi:MAG: DUF4249 family protein [Flammeovirgaceae bacterium]